jgi:hypothetical protein
MKLSPMAERFVLPSGPSSHLLLRPFRKTPNKSLAHVFNEVSLPKTGERDQITPIRAKTYFSPIPERTPGVPHLYPKTKARSGRC